METIPLINNINGVKKLTDSSRIYFGHEFCFHMLPALREISSLLVIMKQKKIDFSFVTPYINECDLEGMKSLLKKICESFPTIEVIVNDWGIFHYIKKNFGFKLVIGRLLTKQKRGFFIEHNGSIKKIEKFKMSAYDKYYLKSSVLDNSYIVDFLIENNITRVGIDNLAYGINKNRTPLKVDLYYPYCYLTTSNYCMANLLKTGKEKLQRATRRCRRFCLSPEKTFMKIADRGITLKGNTQFYKVSGLPKNVSELNADRIIETAL